MNRVKWWLCILFVFLVEPSCEFTTDVEFEDDSDKGFTGYPITNEFNQECPGNGEICIDCCNSTKNNFLICFQGRCRDCYDGQTFKCSAHSRNEDLLITATRIAMSAALVLGIVTFLTLLWRICTDSTRRNFPRRRNRRRPRESTRSTDTLQQIVAERLQDAPPPYTRAPLPPPGDTPPPYNVSDNHVGHINDCFDPDYNVPPPAYNTIIPQQQGSSNSEDPKIDTRSNNEELPKITETLTDPTLHM